MRKRAGGRNHDGQESRQSGGVDPACHRAGGAVRGQPADGDPGVQPLPSGRPDAVDQRALLRLPVPCFPAGRSRPLGGELAMVQILFGDLDHLYLFF